MLKVTFHSTLNSLPSNLTISYPHTSQYHLPTLIDLILLLWFFHYYSFKLSHKNHTLFSLKPPFSNLTFAYFWEVVSHHLHLLPQHHQSHLHLACLFTSHLCHLPHILPQIPLYWHNVSSDTNSNDLEVYSIHHLTWVPWRPWAILGKAPVHR